VRPINLIPSDERRRTGGVATRTGPTAYLIVGVLGVLLIGVVMLVLLGNSIHDQEGEVARLESEKAVATAKASNLADYTDFQQVAEQRTNTISELADARFDWVRVVRQLSLVLPKQIHLTSLNASGGESSETGVSAPTMHMNGCASSQPEVGAFITALKQIDGVTRVELNSSTVGAGGGGEGGSCPSSDSTQFDLIVAFDGAKPTPDTGAVEEGEVSSESEEGSTESEGSESSTESEGTESSSSENGSTAAVTPSTGANG
jgi:Tfp pilus assembly protein PilN